MSLICYPYWKYKFTKLNFVIQVSKGLELVPRNETFDLAESLQLPIDCVNGMHCASVIKLGVMSADICRHIISDKQVHDPLQITLLL